MSERLALWVATGFGLGRLPLAPGTWGTVAGAGYAWALSLLPWLWQLTVICAGLGVAVWLSGAAEILLQRRDPPEVVIDEIAAFPLATVFAWESPYWLVLLAAAFVFFRVVDILKPPPVRQAQRLPGGWGVVADDIAAAVVAGIVVGILRWAVA